MARGGIFLQIHSAERERKGGKGGEKKEPTVFCSLSAPEARWLLKWSDDKCLIWSLIQWQGGGARGEGVGERLWGDKTGNAHRMLRLGKFQWVKSLLLMVHICLGQMNEWMNKDIFSVRVFSCQNKKQKTAYKDEDTFANMSEYYPRLNPSKTLYFCILLLFGNIITSDSIPV